jgi:hypothetical protein
LLAIAEGAIGRLRVSVAPRRLIGGALIDQSYGAGAAIDDALDKFGANA